MAEIGATRSAKRCQRIVLVVLLLVVVAVFGLGWVATRRGTEGAGIGECVRQDGTDAVSVVDCADLVRIR